MDYLLAKIIAITGKSGFVLALYVGIFSIIKIILVPKLREFRRAMASIFVGFPTGYLAGSIMLDKGFGENLSIAFAVMIALIADKIILFIIHMDVKDYLDRIINNTIDKKTK